MHLRHNWSLIEENERKYKMTANAIAPAAEQTPTPVELDRARLYIEQTKLGILGVLKNVSDSQWTFKPSVGGWSIAETVEHVVLVLGRVVGPVWDKLMGTAATAVHPDFRQIDDLIIYQFPNRLTKFPSPVPPLGGLDRHEALEQLSEDYGRLSERLERPGIREHALEAPPLRAITNGAYVLMDGYQWILAAAAHTERHTKQLLEIMADPGFPE